MSSTVVASNPLVLKSARAVAPISSRVVLGGRPDPVRRCACASRESGLDNVALSAVRLRDCCHPERRVEMSEAPIATQQSADTESVSEVEATEIAREQQALV